MSETAEAIEQAAKAIEDHAQRYADAKMFEAEEAAITCAGLVRAVGLAHPKERPMRAVDEKAVMP